jgi:hypothetical protein
MSKRLKKDKKGRVIIPLFDSIEQNELVTGDIILFLNGNKFTEWHGKNRKKKYGRSTRPPYHAAIVLGMCEGMPIILDPELNTTLSPLLEYTRKKNVRIDVVRFEATFEQRQAIAKKILEIASKEGFYDWRGFGSFASQMPYVGWMFKWIKPSNKDFFCSDGSTYCVQTTTDIRVSPRKANATAPVDNQIYGMRHHDMRTLKKEGEIWSR